MCPPSTKCDSKISRFGFQKTWPRDGRPHYSIVDALSENEWGLQRQSHTFRFMVLELWYSSSTMIRYALNDFVRSFSAYPQTRADELTSLSHILWKLTYFWMFLVIIENAPGPLGSSSPWLHDHPSKLSGEFLQRTVENGGLACYGELRTAWTFHEAADPQHNRLQSGRRHCKVATERTN